MASWQYAVDRFCCQYLQLEQDLDFPSADCLPLDVVQDAIFRRLFALGAVRHGPPVRYQVRTLKELVSRITASIDDWDEHAVSDNLMSALSGLLSTPLPAEAASARQRCYVTYRLSALARDPDEVGGGSAEVPDVTLLESRSLISAGGTTGLRTWEAALHLGQYLCANAAIVSGKRVLELGAGTGYLSILCAKHLSCASAVASDGSDDVVDHLADNLLLNGLRDASRVRPTTLKWGQALVGVDERPGNGGGPVDVVLGADITYDQSVLPALVATLLDLFELYPLVEVYISATQRNEETFEAFLDASRRKGLVVEDIEFPMPTRQRQQAPFYSGRVPIRLCGVSKAGRQP
ncbi:hypothetical protein RJ55_04499 [Drechmeria coniospora]|nr:hypothetical protein RJ55_04499 [Drechmeria coniospora]